MNNIEFIVSEWASKIEQTFCHLDIVKSFGRHIYIKDDWICTCRPSKSDFKRILNQICKAIPIDILRTIIIAMRITSTQNSGGLFKSGKRYHLVIPDIHLDEYFEYIRKLNRNGLSDELKNMGLSHPHWNMICLGSITTEEIIYKDFNEKRFPIWAFPGGLTLNAKKLIKKENYELPFGA